MPVYNYKCRTCGHLGSRVFGAGTQPPFLPCTAFIDVPDTAPGTSCQGVAFRDRSGPTSRIVEVRDNGVMPRKIEQLADAERLFKERANQPNSKFRKF